MIQDDPIFMGRRIELFEPDGEARKRLKDAIRTFGIKLDMVLTSSGPAQEAATEAINIGFRNLRAWLVDVRFAPGYKVQREPRKTLEAAKK
jgi:hypothetical protein